MNQHIVPAQAGPSGEKIRSDLTVRYEPGPHTFELEISSKVGYLYGDAIHAAARRVANALGATTGTLTVEDFGALEWVILARVETCLRRAGFDGDPVLPAPAPDARAAQVRDRLRRSRLYVPGNQPKLMLSAGLYGADGIILDLEDSVPPAEKDAARILVRNALVAMDFGGAERMVRINQDTAGTADIDAIAPHNVHTVLIPKVERPEQVRRTAARLSQSGEAQPFLMPILESPLGIRNAYEIAAADPSIVALTLGLEDLSAELGAPRTADAWESFLARQTIVYAARAADVSPIASVFSDVRDEAGLEAYVRRERALGFDGVGCIHPRQIPVVHRAMAPSESELERALRIVQAAQTAKAKGFGTVAVGSKMVDPPVVRQAERTVRLAVAAGMIAPDTANREARDDA